MASCTCALLCSVLATNYRVNEGGWGGTDWGGGREGRPENTETLGEGESYWSLRWYNLPCCRLWLFVVISLVWSILDEGAQYSQLLGRAGPLR